MLRQLNVKRQLTIPAPLAKRFGFNSKGWVDVAEKGGALIIRSVDIEARHAPRLELSDREWRALNRKVREELKAGKGKVHADAGAFVSDLRRRIRA